MIINPHEIKENALVINNQQYFPINVEKVIVGVENPDKTEILKDDETGLNYARNAVEGKDIYDRRKQKHSAWFILDFENGSRGWFPGSVIHGNIIESTNIMSEPSAESTVLKTIDHAIVQVLDIDTIDEEPFYDGWYKIKYDIVGFVPEKSVTNLRYDSPI